MSSIEFEIKRAKARKGETGSKNGKFEGEMRVGGNTALVKGMTYQFPSEFTEDNVRNSAMGQYTFITDTNANASQFWPSLLWRFFDEYTLDGDNRPVATGETCETTGTLVDFFKSYPSVDEAMQNLKNRKFTVKDAVKKGRLDFNDASKVRQTWVYNLELIEDKK